MKRSKQFQLPQKLNKKTLFLNINTTMEALNAKLSALEEKQMELADKKRQLDDEECALIQEKHQLEQERLKLSKVLLPDEKAELRDQLITVGELLELPSVILGSLRVVSESPTWDGQLYSIDIETSLSFDSGVSGLRIDVLVKTKEPAVEDVKRDTVSPRNHLTSAGRSIGITTRGSSSRSARPKLFELRQLLHQFIKFFRTLLIIRIDLK